MNQKSKSFIEGELHPNEFFEVKNGRVLHSHLSLVNKESESDVLKENLLPGEVVAFTCNGDRINLTIGKVEEPYQQKDGQWRHDYYLYFNNN